jgi:hypothetical protein
VVSKFQLRGSDGNQCIGNKHAKFINVLHSLTPCHAQKVAEAIAADVLTSTTMVDEEVSKNRTMHEMARAMHVITDTDNIAALSKALGRYNRLELDRAQSKLDEAIEVNICAIYFSCQLHRLHISFLLLLLFVVLHCRNLFLVGNS